MRFLDSFNHVYVSVLYRFLGVELTGVNIIFFTTKVMIYRDRTFFFAVAFFGASVKIKYYHSQLFLSRWGLYRYIFRISESNCFPRPQPTIQFPFSLCRRFVTLTSIADVFKRQWCWLWSRKIKTFLLSLHF